MRRIIVFAALMGLTACGGEPRPEETEAPVSAESACSGNTWECACAKYKSQTTCNAAPARCVWVVSKCEPTYE